MKFIQAFRLEWSHVWDPVRAECAGLGDLALPGAGKDGADFDRRVGAGAACMTFVTVPAGC